MDLSRLILTPSQMRTAELSASAHGITVSALMETAGEALGRRVLNIAERLMKNSIVIICGTGNNGGDGYVAASFLQAAYTHVTIIKCGEPKTELSKAASARITGRCEIISIKQANSDPSVIDKAGIIVDCAFGIAFRGELPKEIQKLFLRCSLSSAYKLACDCPSGVNCLSGRISPMTFEADETLTFHKPKLGLLLSPAKERCGKINVTDLGIGDYVDEYAKVRLMTTDKEFTASLLPYRVEDSHKGIYGRVTLVCGSWKYPGAAMLAAKSALRSGVGIVNLCTHIAAVGAAVTKMPECTFTPISSDEKGFMDERCVEPVMRAIEMSSAAVIGCGIGKSEGTEKMVCELIRRSKVPLIIDADGINCLAEHIDVLKEKQSEIILTPHPAELARLCGTDTASVTQDMFGHACEIAEQYNVTVHAKSTQTLTVKGSTCYLTDFGCSALAKGGSGDVLAGLIGGFMAQGIASERACILGDYVMGTSARELCKTRSPRGILPTDIIDRFPETLYSLEHGI